MVCPLHFLSYLDGLCMFYRLTATYPQMEDTPTSTVMTYPGRSAPLRSAPPTQSWLAESQGKVCFKGRARPLGAEPGPHSGCRPVSDQR